jgi:hypothetical protein
MRVELPRFGAVLVLAAAVVDAAPAAGFEPPLAHAPRDAIARRPVNVRIVIWAPTEEDSKSKRKLSDTSEQSLADSERFEGLLTASNLQLASASFG